PQPAVAGTRPAVGDATCHRDVVRRSVVVRTVDHSDENPDQGYAVTGETWQSDNKELPLPRLRLRADPIAVDPTENKPILLRCNQYRGTVCGGFVRDRHVERNRFVRGAKHMRLEQ